MTTSKIVIVAGQEFSVPADTDNEAIREQLKAMGFADVATATITTGTKTIGDTAFETVEFVKRAGTKGLDHTALAGLLSTLPAGPLPPRRRNARVLHRLACQRLTFGEAVTAPLDAQLALALTDAGDTPYDTADVIPDQFLTTQESQLCRDIDQLPAVASAVSVW